MGEKTFSAPPVSVLMAGAPREFESVDDVKSYFAAYCTMTPVQRNATTLALIDMVSHLVNPIDSSDEEKYETVDSLSRTLNGAFDRIRSAVGTGEVKKPLVQDAIPFKYSDVLKPDLADEKFIVNQFIVFQRNRTWVDRFPSEIANEHLPFFALGAEHFADGPNGIGLISMLREMGYNISIVSGKRQLIALLAKIPPEAASSDTDSGGGISEHAMAGQCIKIPGNYHCGWKYDETFISVMRDSAGIERLSGCVKRKSVYGPHNNCFHLSVPISKQRELDLIGAKKLAEPSQ